MNPTHVSKNKSQGLTLTEPALMVSNPAPKLASGMAYVGISRARDGPLQHNRRPAEGPMRDILAVWVMPFMRIERAHSQTWRDAPHWLAAARVSFMTSGAARNSMGITAEMQSLRPEETLQDGAKKMTQVGLGVDTVHSTYERDWIRHRMARLSGTLPSMDSVMAACLTSPDPRRVASVGRSPIRDPVLAQLCTKTSATFAGYTVSPAANWPSILITGNGMMFGASPSFPQEVFRQNNFNVAWQMSPATRFSLPLLLDLPCWQHGSPWVFTLGDCEFAVSEWTSAATGNRGVVLSGKMFDTSYKLWLCENPVCGAFAWLVRTL